MTADMLAARWKILRAANQYRLRSGLAKYVGLYGMRQIQQAVAVCRHWRLVPAEVLEAAGYNARPAHQ